MKGCVEGRSGEGVGGEGWVREWRRLFEGVGRGKGWMRGVDGRLEKLV